MPPADPWPVLPSPEPPPPLAEPPAPAPEPAPTTVSRFLIWTYTLGGFAGLVVALAAAAAILGPAPRDPALRQGLAVGVVLAMAVNVGALAAGTQLLRERPQGRPLALAVALAGLAVGVGALAVLAVSRPWQAFPLAGAGPMILAAAGMGIVVAFFAWAIVHLARAAPPPKPDLPAPSETADGQRIDDAEPRPRAAGQRADRDEAGDRPPVT